LKTPFVPAHLLRGFAQYLRGLSFGVIGQVVSEMGKIKGFPIEETISMNGIPGLPALSAEPGSGPGPILTIVSSADTVDEAPLGDDLFAIPTDYKKVDPPVPTGGG
jgi:hypothetical protein